MRHLAHRWIALTNEITELDCHLERLAAGDNPNRMHTEARFAALCGAAPVDASSGRQQHHRLCRSGNRDTNRALNRIALVRMRFDPATRSYVARGTEEEKTKREIMRYIAREVFPLLPQTT